jgi:hypothetical protein
MRNGIVLLFAISALSLDGQTTEAEGQLMRWVDRIAQEQLDRREAEIKQLNTVDAQSGARSTFARPFRLLGGLPDHTGPRL